MLLAITLNAAQLDDFSTRTTLAVRNIGDSLADQQTFAPITYGIISKKEPEFARYTVHRLHSINRFDMVSMMAIQHFQQHVTRCAPTLGGLRYNIRLRLV